MVAIAVGACDSQRLWSIDFVVLTEVKDPMSSETKPEIMRAAILDAVHRAARQEQFLEVVSAAEARRRFEERVDRSPLPGESLPLAGALSRVIAADVIAPVDAPPFDRANVDGFAVRAT